MFMLRKTHEAEVKRLDEQQLKTIELYEYRIADLKGQIEDLKRLVFTPASKPEPLHLEADAVLSGSDKPVALSEEEHHKFLEQTREVDLLFSGNYSEDLLQ